ncbi:MAG: anthranilate phosphoribosyltransferase [Candidatus Micrarchaeota archaeon]
MLAETIQKLVEKRDLETDEAEGAMEEITGGNAPDSHIAAFLTALKMKGETPAEIYGLAKVMREKSVSVKAPPNAMDLCGTGGDGKGTFNISTAASFVVAGAGIPVAKHGNKSISSRCGSADVLKELGINVDMDAGRAETCLRKCNIAFLFAPNFHPSMMFVAPIRKQLGFRTVFNLLGPLCNPAKVKFQVLGVYDKALLPKIAEVLRLLGSERALVVASETDEISASSETLAAEISNGAIRDYVINPQEFGFSSFTLGAIKGGDAKENARIIRDVLDGIHSPYLDSVIINAGAAIYIAGKAAGISKGIGIALDSIHSGAAREALDKLRVESNA